MIQELKNKDRTVYSGQHCAWIRSGDITSGL